MELSVYNIKGEDTGRKVALNDEIFGIEPNDHVIYLAVKQYLADQRQGTAKSKERSEISGSTRKLIRQKGSGGARRGDIKSPVLRGGGRVFGPRPRNYSFKLNKKVKRLARRSALSLRASQEALIVLDNLTFEAPKTKALIEVLANLKVADKKVLIVLAQNDYNVFRSSTNLQKANVITAGELNTYSIMNANTVIFTEGALTAVEATLA